MKIFGKKLSLLIIALLCANMIITVASAASAAQWPDSSTPADVLINQNTDGYQSQPTMTQTSDGNYIVVWLDESDALQSADIYAQKISAADGSSLWVSDVAIATTGSFTYEGYLVVRPDEAGGAFIGYLACNGPLGCNVASRSPRVQKIDTDGNKLWGADGVDFDETVIFNEYIDEVLSDGSGGVYVSLDRGTIAGQDSDVFITRLDSTGSTHTDWNPAGEDDYRYITFPEAIEDDGSEYGGVLRSDGSGNVYIICGFNDASDVSPDGSIYIAKIDNTGALLWSGGTPEGARAIDPEADLSESTTNDEINGFSVAENGSGGLYFGLQNDYSVKIANLNADGTYTNTANWDDNTGNAVNEGKTVYNASESSFENFPSDILVLGDASHNLYLAYGIDEVYMQKFDDDGSPLWNGGAEILTSDDTDAEFAGFDQSDYYYKTGALDGNGGFILAYEDSAVSGYVTKITSAGVLDWGEFGTLIDTDTNDNMRPTVAPAAGGGAVVAFNNFNGASDEDIFAQYYISEGGGGGSEPGQITNLTAVGGNLQALLNWTAPADNGSAITDYEIRYSTDGFNRSNLLFEDSVSTDTSDVLVTGLVNFFTYTFRVRAINGVGAAAAPGSNDATGVTTPCGDLDDNEEAGSTTSQGCVGIDVAANDIVLQNVPDSFAFPSRFFSFSAQNSFSNDNPATTTSVDVTTGPEDVVTVRDLRNSGGFDLNISVSEFTSGSNEMPIRNIYVLSTYPDANDLTPLDPNLNGTEAGGVEYAAGSNGTQDIVSSIFTTGNLNSVTTYTTGGESFDGDNDLVSDIISLMSTATNHTMSASQALSFYLNIPADQPAGNYSVLFTLDLIPN